MTALFNLFNFFWQLANGSCFCCFCTFFQLAKSYFQLGWESRGASALSTQGEGGAERRSPKYTRRGQLRGGVNLSRGALSTPGGGSGDRIQTMLTLSNVNTALKPVGLWDET